MHRLSPEQSDRRPRWHASEISPISRPFERTSKRRKGFPSETQVKRGSRVVHGHVELLERLGRSDLCPCGTGLRFQALLPCDRLLSMARNEGTTGGTRAQHPVLVVCASPGGQAAVEKVMHLAKVFATVVALALAGSADMASVAAPQNWHDVKCARYSKAWAAALAHQGTAGLGAAFLASHAAFLASNCMRRADVCARSPQELELANTMVILSMNAGTASTFPPFYCRQ